MAGSATPDTTKIDALLASALEHHRADRLGEAETLYREILEREPRHADALHLLGLIGHQFGQYFQASELIMAAIAIRPQAIYYYNLGNVMQANNRPAAAVECFRQAIALQPDYVDAYNNLGNALRQQGDLTAAVESFVKVITLKQDHAQAYNNLGNTLMELDELDAAIESYGAAIALSPELPVPRSNMLFALNYRSDFAPQAYLEEASRFDEAATRGVTAWRDWLVQPALPIDRPLRVGIVSGDLKQHPVGYFLESVVKNLDMRRVALYAYPARDVEDVLTSRIKARFASWKCIGGMTDEAAAKMIRDDQIEVLIDASGHTVHNRLAVFAWKPAPVQVTWPGYFASTGLKAMDYILADRHVLPASEAAHFTETPWLLPDSYLCFTPPTEYVQVGELPMVANGYPTFGYFGKLAKISEATVAVWARLLNAVPESRLFLKAQHLDAPHASETMYARFASHGIDASRLFFEGRSPRAAYLNAYRRVDIALSPFPYPGGTTTAEALWMGVPVVCLRGERFLSHICESILHSAGLSDWIAASADEYIAKAASYASNIEQLRVLRGQLRAQLLASPLCDAARFAQNLEDALHGMWASHVSKVTESAR
ncbi:tetratricopeptide repeat protein [Paraburkholderia phymatum]|uniref:Tetratricopeptide repeat protein n=1 Tax=Paraburkholderia phymatum TaxID=148447 RepID=A0ACC6U8V5_9BURK